MPSKGLFQPGFITISFILSLPGYTSTLIWFFERNNNIQNAYKQAYFVISKVCPDIGVATFN